MKYGFMFWCRPSSAMLPTIVSTRKRRHIICPITPKRNVIFQNEMRKKRAGRKPYGFLPAFNILLFYKTRIILQESYLLFFDDVRLQIQY